MTGLYNNTTINEKTMFLKPKYEAGYSLIININCHGCKTLINHREQPIFFFRNFQATVGINFQM